jgi:predicted acetyltransferase
MIYSLVSEGTISRIKANREFRFRGEINLRDHVLAVAGNNGFVVGYIDFVIKDQEVIILYAEVTPEYRGRGLMKELMVSLRNNTGHKQFYLMPLDPSSEAFYRHLMTCGFDIRLEE